MSRHSKNVLIHQLFELQVQQTPDAIAAVFEQKQLTYQALNDRANQLAHYLRSQGVGPEVLVGICVERSLDMLVGLLGILKAGGAYVPLDPVYPQDRLAFMLEDAQVKVLLTQSQLLATLPAQEAQVVCLDRDWEAIAQASTENPLSEITAENLAYVIYTSGSTGKPKGVMIQHGSLASYIQAASAEYELTDGDRLLQFASISFDVSADEIYTCLSVGATLVLRTEQMLASVETFLQQCQAWELTVLSLPTSYWHELTLQLVAQNLSLPPSVRLVIIGGEKALAIRWQEWQQQVGQVRLINAYGPTEATISSLLCDLSKLDAMAFQEVPIGQAMQNVEVYILDEALQPVAPGETGELYIGGAGLARGYLNRPELTAEKFITSPLTPSHPSLLSPSHPSPLTSPSSPLYKTGDLVRALPDGNLEFLGRVDHQVKIRGFRIELGEIEALLNQHPAVQEAVVVEREDTAGQKRLVAYLRSQQSNQAAVELWPSMGEYPVYDELLYHSMTTDEPRNQRYQQAIAAVVQDQVVVEIGTGQDAILARMCVAAGAKKVYAIEGGETAYKRATALIERLGLEEKIILIHGYSTEVDLPELADVCVSEIIGTIGSSEGVAAILNDAWRFLKPEGRMIPHRCTTRMAAVTLPDGLLGNLRFNAVPGHYVQQVFDHVGGPFDLRLCLKHLPPSHLISDSGVFEDLVFDRPTAPDYEQNLTLRVTQSGRFDGFLLWLNLQTAPGMVIDNSVQEYSWLPVYFPIFYPGLEVTAGDRIEVNCMSCLSDNHINPDYRVSGFVVKQSGEAIPFGVDFLHHESPSTPHPFYKALFPHRTVPISQTADALSTTNLRTYLANQLPEYMVPAAFVTLQAWPLTPNDKIDRRALPAPEPTQYTLEATYAAPRNPLEEAIAQIWEDVLGLTRVGIHDNFFGLGGHSLLAIQVLSRMRQRFAVELTLRHLFQAPTVASLAQQMPTVDATGSQIPAIHPVKRDRHLPLSFGQQQLWLLHQLAPDLPVYNEPSAIYLPEAINVAALHASLNALIQRHEILRTTFRVLDGQPVQIIAPTLSIPLPVVDLRSLPVTEREATALQLATEAARQPFDLAHGPLLRALLVQLDAAGYRLFLTMHHIIDDAVSGYDVLLPELEAVYKALCNSKPVSLPPLAIQYADFAVWQRQWLTAERMERSLTYWQQQLADLPMLQLPTDRPRPAVQTFRGSRECLTLSPALTESLKALARQEGVTLFTVLLTAFKALLHRYAGQTEIVVGTVTAGRDRPELESLMGFFLNTLVLRTDFSGSPSFQELVARVQEVTLGAYAHQEVPFEQLVAALQPDHDLSQNPLFQVMFILEPSLPDLESGWTLSQLAVETGTAKLDLTVELEERAEGIIGRFEYSTDLFERETITRMIGHFQTLLTGIVAQPEQPIATLPLLTPAEWQQLELWNQTQADYPQQACIHELFEAQVLRSPNQIAAVFADEPLTYGQLNTRANQLAHYLQNLGVGPDVLVGLWVNRSLDMLVGMLGILKAGAAYVPLDPAFPPQRLEFMLADAQVPVLLTQSSFVDRLPPHQAQVICLDSDWEAIAQGSTTNPVHQAQPDNLAYVIYTSGSTGKPKGVQVMHRGVVNFLSSMQQQPGMTAEDILLAVTTITFDIAALELFLPLTVGAKVVIVSREVAADGAQLLEHLMRSGATVMQATPATWRLLLASGWSEQNPLKVLCGGEALPPELAQQLRSRSTSLWNLYGPTETTIWSTYCLASTENPNVSIGRPIANTQIYLLDTHLQPVPIGVPGELYIGGAGLARGYLNRPELTAEKFITPSFLTPLSSLLYKTGDLARYLPDGNLEYLGRIDQQVKIRGFRIELGEIETVLGQHPAVQEAVVVAREDQTGDQRLVAYLTLQPAIAASDSELRRHMQTQLPEYMVPSAFIVLEQFPLTPNGKVDRRALVELEGAALEQEHPLVAPRTPVEEMLAGIWFAVLGVATVGVHDNFFALGGHSLLATQLISRIRQTFGVELSLRHLFEAPTIAQLAKCVESTLTQSPSRSTPLLIERPATIPLSFAQQRLWFLDQLEAQPGLYNIPIALELTGDLQIPALERGLNAIVQRHEALRTRFPMTEGVPEQVIEPAFTLNLPVVDLRSLPSPEREPESQRLAAEFARYSFDLTQELLLRATLVQLEDTEYRLLLTMHHIISDGWSIEVLLKELAAFYEAACTGQPASLPTLPVQYADFAVWQRQWLQEVALDTQLTYWQQQLADAPSLLELPSDRPRPAVQSFRGAYHSFKVSQGLSQELTALSQQSGVTLFMTLLAAFQVLLHRYSGQSDILVGTPIANRNRTEIEGLIGFFVNTLVLRTDLAGNPSFEQLLNRVREVALAAYAHQELPFEQLVEVLQPERNLSYTPLFQVMFVLQNNALPAQEVEGVRWQTSDIETGAAKFDLTLFLEVTDQGLVGTWEYSTDLFDASTIARMTGHFQNLLTGIVADPQQSIATLPLMSLAEREQLLVEWNRTQSDYPADLCIHEVFAAQVARSPAALAVTFQEQTLTYQQLNARADQLAQYLRSLGVGPEVLVGLFVERSLEMLVGILGILKAGGAYVPLDPTYPAERLAFMLADTQAPVLLTQAQFLPSLPPHQARVICLDQDWDIIQQPRELNLEQVGDRPTPDNLAYVMYTSGSTGKPKGVPVVHRGVVRLVKSTNYAHFGEDEVFLQLAPISFDASTLEIWGSLLNGGRLVVMPPQTPSLQELGQAICNYQITTLWLTTGLFHLMVDERLEDLRSLRQLLAGGDVLAPTHVKKALQALPNCQIINGYGPTENTTFTCCYPITESSLIEHSVPIGRPIANTQVYLLDTHLQPVPIGVPGELYIGGAGLARGYLNRPELTAEKFITPSLLTPHPSPLPPHPSPLYKTGDLARYLPDGNIEYLGRIDQQVKLRGFRIELGEIEAVLDQHPDIREVAVMVREDVPGDKRLVAYIVSGLIPDRVPMQIPCLVELENYCLIHLQTEDISVGGLCLAGVSINCSPGQLLLMRLYLPVAREAIWLEGRVAWQQGERVGIQFTEKSAQEPLVHQTVEHLLEAQGLFRMLQRTITGNLRNFLKQKLPDYMIPSTFVMLPALPLTPNGKVDRRALPAPQQVRSEAEETVVAPRTPIEEVMAGVWTEVLGLSEVSIHDNFFELGGHSLLGTQIISRLRAIFQIDLPLRSLFESPTIAALAKALETRQLDPSVQQAPPILPAGRDRPLPLSFSQQQMWLLAQLQPETPYYNHTLTLRRQGTINAIALEQALNELVRRHEVWRTNFVMVDGLPVQVVQPPFPVALTRLNLQALPVVEREAEAIRLMSAEVRRPFDLATDRLLRATLIELDENDHRFFLTLHHIIYDGISLHQVFLPELAALYDAFCAQQPSPLPELSIQYADFAVWEQEWLTPEVLEPHLAYWQKQLTELPTLQLPSDRPHPAVPSFAGGIHPVSLSKDLTEKLRTLARREGVTLGMLLQGAFQTLLCRYSGQEDIPIGVITAGRNQPELEGVLGLFINFLVLRTDVSGNPSFRQLLSRVREVALAAYAHQDVPFQKLVELLRSERRLGQNPLYQVMFLFDMAKATGDTGWTMNLTDIHNGTTTCDLVFALDDQPEGLSGGLEYSTELFDASTIERMAGHWLTLLEGIVANPEQAIADLPLLTPAEQQQLAAWNQTQVDYPLHLCLHQLIEAQVDRSPDAIAVVFEDQHLTYRELDQRANQLAHILKRLEIGPDRLVGICVERSLEMVVGLLGILKAGGAYVPLDPGYPKERLAYMLEDAQVPVLLTQAHLVGQLPSHQAKVICLDQHWPAIAQASRSDRPKTEVAAEHLAYVIYTSGSTGKPKGAMNTHRGICNRLLWMQDAYSLTEGDRVLQKTPFSFDVSVWEFFWPLITGARLVVARPEGHKDAGYLVQLIAQQQITTLHFVPSMLQAFLEEPELAECCSLKRVICSGEALPIELQARFFQRLQAELHNLYGPTEAAVDVTFWACQPDSPLRTVPIGRPIANTQLYILDAHLNPVPVGVPGELHIGGVGLARGYLNRPELTAEKFITPSPLTPLSSPLYKTGDLARYLPDGNIEYLGRIDHQVKIRGFRIELGEIETALGQHSNVREVVVVAREDLPGDKRLVAYLVPHQMPAPDNAELQALLKQQLPEYMVPAVFVSLSAMPINANGKLDRKLLPVPDSTRPHAQFVAPRNPVEVQLAQIWSAVLGLEPVGIHDNFLEIGGHSLLATQVISRSRQVFQVDLPLSSLFAAPTIAELAEAIAKLQQHPTLSQSPAATIQATSREARRMKRTSLS